MSISIPASLAAACNSVPERASWLQRLPALIASLAEEWSLTLGAPFEASLAWAAVVTRADGTPAVLKVSLPHWEGADEIAGLRFWAGNPTVHLLQSDESTGAMLLERCYPGTPLSTLPEPDQVTSSPA